jgi:predicted PurR-regulated permease PerM
MGQTAKRVALATVIVIAILATALALWKLKLVIALVFLGFILAAAMRPGIDGLRRRGVPRAIGLMPALLVLISVTSVGILFGAFAVIAVPLVAVLVTVIDVVARQKEPAEEEIPTVPFPAKEAET